MAKPRKPRKPGKKIIRKRVRTSLRNKAGATARGRRMAAILGPTSGYEGYKTVEREVDVPGSAAAKDRAAAAGKTKTPPKSNAKTVAKAKQANAAKVEAKAPAKGKKATARPANTRAARMTRAKQDTPKASTRRLSDMSPDEFQTHYRATIAAAREGDTAAAREAKRLRDWGKANNRLNKDGSPAKPEAKVERDRKHAKAKADADKRAKDADAAAKQRNKPEAKADRDDAPAKPKQTKQAPKQPKQDAPKQPEQPDTLDPNGDDTDTIDAAEHNAPVYSADTDYTPAPTLTGDARRRADIRNMDDEELAGAYQDARDRLDAYGHPPRVSDIGEAEEVDDLENRILEMGAELDARSRPEDNPFTAAEIDMDTTGVDIPAGVAGREQEWLASLDDDTLEQVLRDAKPELRDMADEEMERRYPWREDGILQRMLPHMSMTDIRREQRRITGGDVYDKQDIYKMAGEAGNHRYLEHAEHAFSDWLHQQAQNAATTTATDAKHQQEIDAFLGSGIESIGSPIMMQTMSREMRDAATRLGYIPNRANWARIQRGEAPRPYNGEMTMKRAYGRRKRRSKDEILRDKLAAENRRSAKARARADKRAAELRARAEKQSDTWTLTPDDADAALEAAEAALEAAKAAENAERAMADDSRVGASPATEKRVTDARRAVNKAARDAEMAREVARIREERDTGAPAVDTREADALNAELADMDAAAAINAREADNAEVRHAADASDRADLSNASLVDGEESTRNGGIRRGNALMFPNRDGSWSVKALDNERAERGKGRKAATLDDARRIADEVGVGPVPARRSADNAGKPKTDAPDPYGVRDMDDDELAEVIAETAGDPSPNVRKEHRAAKREQARRAAENAPKQAAPKQAAPKQDATKRAKAKTADDYRADYQAAEQRAADAKIAVDDAAKAGADDNTLRALVTTAHDRQMDAHLKNIRFLEARLAESEQARAEGRDYDHPANGTRKTVEQLKDIRRRGGKNGKNRQGMIETELGYAKSRAAKDLEANNTAKQDTTPEAPGHVAMLMSDNPGVSEGTYRKRVREHAATLSNDDLLTAYEEARAEVNEKGVARAARNVYKQELDDRRLTVIDGHGTKVDHVLARVPQKWGNHFEKKWFKHPEGASRDAALELNAKNYRRVLEMGGMSPEDAAARVDRERRNHPDDPHGGTRRRGTPGNATTRTVTNDNGTVTHIESNREPVVDGFTIDPNRDGGFTVTDTNNAGGGTPARKVGDYPDIDAARAARDKAVADRAAMPDTRSDDTDADDYEAVGNAQRAALDAYSEVYDADKANDPAAMDYAVQQLHDAAEALDATGQDDNHNITRNVANMISDRQDGETIGSGLMGVPYIERHGHKIVPDATGVDKYRVDDKGRRVTLDKARAAIDKKAGIAAPKKARHKKGDPFEQHHLDSGETLNDTGAIQRGDHTIISNERGYQVMEQYDQHRLGRPVKTLGAARKQADRKQAARDKKQAELRESAAARKATADTPKPEKAADRGDKHITDALNAAEVKPAHERYNHLTDTELADAYTAAKAHSLFTDIGGERGTLESEMKRRQRRPIEGVTTDDKGRRHLTLDDHDQATAAGIIYDRLVDGDNYGPNAGDDEITVDDGNGHALRFGTLTGSTYSAMPENGKDGVMVTGDDRDRDVKNIATALRRAGFPSKTALAKRRKETAAEKPKAAASTSTPRARKNGERLEDTRLEHLLRIGQKPDLQTDKAGRDETVAALKRVHDANDGKGGNKVTDAAWAVLRQDYGINHTTGADWSFKDGDPLPDDIDAARREAVRRRRDALKKRDTRDLLDQYHNRKGELGNGEYDDARPTADELKRELRNRGNYVTADGFVTKPEDYDRAATPDTPASTNSARERGLGLEGGGGRATNKRHTPGTPFKREQVMLHEEMGGDLGDRTIATGVRHGITITSNPDTKNYTVAREIKLGEGVVVPVSEDAKTLPQARKLADKWDSLTGRQDMNRKALRDYNDALPEQVMRENGQEKVIPGGIKTADGDKITVDKSGNITLTRASGEKSDHMSVADARAALASEAAPAINPVTGKAPREFKPDTPETTATRARMDALEGVDTPDASNERRKLRRELSKAGVEHRSASQRAVEAAQVAYKPTAAERKPDNAGLYFDERGAWEPLGTVRLNENSAEGRGLLHVDETGANIHVTGVHVQKNGHAIVTGTNLDTGEPWKHKTGTDRVLSNARWAMGDSRTPQQYHAEREITKRYGPNRDTDDLRTGTRRAMAAEHVKNNPADATVPDYTDEQVDNYARSQVERLWEALGAKPDRDPEFGHVVRDASDKHLDGSNKTAIVDTDGTVYGPARFLSHDENLVDDDIRVTHGHDLIRVEKADEFKQHWRVTGYNQDGKRVTFKTEKRFDTDGPQVSPRYRMTYADGSPMSRDDADKVLEQNAVLELYRRIDDRALPALQLHRDKVVADANDAIAKVRAGTSRPDAAMSRMAAPGEGLNGPDNNEGVFVPVDATTISYNGENIDVPAGLSDKYIEVLNARNGKAPLDPAPDLEAQPDGTVKLRNVGDALGLNVPRIPAGESREDHPDFDIPGTHRNGEYIGADNYRALAMVEASIDDKGNIIVDPSSVKHAPITADEAAETIGAYIDRHGGMDKVMGDAIKGFHRPGTQIDPSTLDGYGIPADDITPDGNNGLNIEGGRWNISETPDGYRISGEGIRDGAVGSSDERLARALSSLSTAYRRGKDNDSLDAHQAEADAYQEVHDGLRSTVMDMRTAIERGDADSEAVADAGVRMALSAIMAHEKAADLAQERGRGRPDTPENINQMRALVEQARVGGMDTAAMRADIERMVADRLTADAPDADAPEPPTTRQVERLESLRAGLGDGELVQPTTGAVAAWLKSIDAADAADAAEERAKANGQHARADIKRLRREAKRDINSRPTKWWNAEAEVLLQADADRHHRITAADPSTLTKAEASEAIAAINNGTYVALQPSPRGMDSADRDRVSPITPEQEARDLRKKAATAAVNMPAPDPRADREKLGYKGDMVIEHSPVEGTLIIGTSKGEGIEEVLKANGWRWSRNLGAWYVPRSRDQRPDRNKIDRTAEALEDAGFTVGTSIDDSRRSAADREAARTERANDRADALADRADAKASKADAAWKRESDASRQLPEHGEPVKVGHHSEKAHRAAFNRVVKAGENALAATRDAEAADAKATAARRNNERRTDPTTVANRIGRLEADIRKMERGNVTGPELDDARDDLTYWQGVRAEQVANGEAMNLTRDDVKPGDLVRTRDGWHKVVKANPKTIAYESGLYKGHTLTKRYDEIVDHKRTEADAPAKDAKKPDTPAYEKHTGGRILKRHIKADEGEKLDRGKINRGGFVIANNRDGGYRITGPEGKPHGGLLAEMQSIDKVRARVDRLREDYELLGRDSEVLGLTDDQLRDRMAGYGKTADDATDLLVARAENLEAYVDNADEVRAANRKARDEAQAAAKREREAEAARAATAKARAERHATLTKEAADLEEKLAGQKAALERHRDDFAPKKFGSLSHVYTPEQQAKMEKDITDAIAATERKLTANRVELADIEKATDADAAAAANLAASSGFAKPGSYIGPDGIVPPGHKWGTL